MNTPFVIVLLLGVALLSGCGLKTGTFGQDLALLREHTDVLVLAGDGGERQVAVVPAYQGRVMTSTLAGESGSSLGWINREHIASGKLDRHINVFGGEERFWLGPEGGQFAIFFEPGDPFDFEHWQTPAVIDTEPFDLVEVTRNRAVFRKASKLVNHAGAAFEFKVDRTISLLDEAAAAASLGLEPGTPVKLVAYESDNVLTNTGPGAWTRETGMLSIWILGMFPPSPRTVVVLPIEPGPDARRGPRVNVYESFGPIPEARLRASEKAVFFRGDGRLRSKIGLSPGRARPVCGSWDAESRVLTLVTFNKPKDAAAYVNSLWKIQERPFGGDVVNAYNDGPVAPGRPPLGPFYELETSSPAAALGPGESIRHVRRTFHLTGPVRELDAVARRVLGVSIAEIEKALP